MSGAEGNPSDVVSTGFAPASEQQQSTKEKLVAVMEDHPERYLATINAVQHDTQRKILYTIQNKMGSPTYTDVERNTTVSQRTVRKHAKRLEEDGLIERHDSQVYTLSFADFEAEVLVRHALDCWFNQ